MKRAKRRKIKEDLKVTVSDRLREPDYDENLINCIKNLLEEADSERRTEKDTAFLYKTNEKQSVKWLIDRMYNHGPDSLLLIRLCLAVVSATDIYQEALSALIKENQVLRRKFRKYKKHVKSLEATTRSNSKEISELKEAEKAMRELMVALMKNSPEADYLDLKKKSLRKICRQATRFVHGKKKNPARVPNNCNKAGGYTVYLPDLEKPSVFDAGYRDSH